MMDKFAMIIFGASGDLTKRKLCLPFTPFTVKTG